MKKIKNIKLIGLIILSIILIVGCSADKKEGSNKYKIGISQLADHPALDSARIGFEEGLKELGVEAEIDYKNAQGDIPNTMSIAQKFVSDEVDLIYTIGTQAAQNAKQATSEIPILFSAVTDPVKSEIVDSWDKVGGNVTGSSDMAPVESQIKMFKEIDPSIKKIGILYNTSEANSEIQINEVKEIAKSEGLEVEISGVSSVNEIQQTLNSLIKKVDALYMLSDNMIASSVELVAKAALDNKMITVSAEENQVIGGLLITNGLNYYDLGKLTAKMAKEILVDKKDINEIPVLIQKETVVTVNEKTLKALGLNENLAIFKNAEKRVN
ncbi:MAG: ABC transporter substrate-binding protein [Clostridium sp.]|nr:ABC transporter substrate-binding protein [Clostridium sp.]